jgi:hypothetical protein
MHKLVTRGIRTHITTRQAQGHAPCRHGASSTHHVNEQATKYSPKQKPCSGGSGSICAKRRKVPPSLAGPFEHVDVLTQVDISPTCERHPLTRRDTARHARDTLTTWRDTPATWRDTLATWRDTPATCPRHGATRSRHGATRSGHGATRSGHGATRPQHARDMAQHARDMARHLCDTPATWRDISATPSDTIATPRSNITPTQVVR